MPIQFIIPDVGVKPKQAQMAEAVALRTSLAACEVRLFNSTIGGVDATTTLAELDAAEATFKGYTAGGEPVANFGDPFIDPEGSGALIVAPTVQFNYDSTAVGGAASEEVGGFYIVDAGNKLRGAVKFDDTVLMADDEDSIPVVAAFRVE